MSEKPRFKVGDIAYYKHWTGELRPVRIIKNYRRLKSYEVALGTYVFMKPNYTIRRRKRVKPHREIRRSRRVGEVSSKYAYNNSDIDRDIADKLRIRDEAKKDADNFLSAFFHKEYRYSDKQPMSLECRKEILLEAIRNKLTEIGIL